jgi:hypothetical protein
LLSVVLVATGCASGHQHRLTLEHQIPVPPEWRSGKGTPGPPGGSDIERYIDAYESGWWRVVREYAKNIGYDPPCDLWTSSGWPAATYGWEQGTGDAIIRIGQLTGAFGRQEVSEYLSQFRDSPWYDPED